MTKLKYVSKEVYEKKKNRSRRFKIVGSALFVGALVTGAAYHFLTGDGIDDYTEDYMANRTNQELAGGDITYDGMPYTSPYVFDNENVIGYISSNALNQDYPVVIGKNNQEYLRKNVDGDYSGNGTIFMDYRNRSQGVDFEEQVTILYGHNMLDGSMFGNLNNYVSQDYYNEHPTFTYYTRDGAYEFEVFASNAVDANTVVNDVNAYENEEAFLNDIADFRANSDFQSDVVVNGDDKVVALMTCADEYDSGRSDVRYIVYAKVKQLTYVNEDGVVMLNPDGMAKFTEQKGISL